MDIHNFFIKILISSFFYFCCPITILATAVVEEDIDSEVPPVVPEFIEQGAEQQLKNWQEIFGEDWLSVIKAVEAVETGDIETFVSEGKNIIKIAPKILPKLGLDLILPVRQDYPGPVVIDPQQAALAVEIGNQLVQVQEGETTAESLLLSLGVIGYDVQAVDVKKVVNEQSLEIISGEIKAKTSWPLKLEKKKLFVLTKDRQQAKLLKKLPSHATREVQSRYKKFVLHQTTLDIRDDQALYIVAGEIDGKILWLFPIKFPVTAEYNAEKGSLERVDKPWWEIFVF